jgi:hypothetical protein
MLVTLKAFLFFMVLWVVVLSSVRGQGTYSYADLCRRLTDPELLAVLPPPGERTALASSYDRSSRYDAATDTYIDWGANNDTGGNVRQEGDGIVMADVTGPGCIWRIWSAAPKSGHVKIYLDGSPTPQVDLPFAEYFDRTSAPFTRTNLVYTAAMGANNYTPICFQRSCRVVADKGWGAFYQITYTQFPAGTIVPTFSVTLPPAENAALDATDKILGACGTAPPASSSGETSETIPLEVTPGAENTVADLSGPAAITGLTVKLDLPRDAKAQRLLLRQLTLSMTWDGEAQPAVWAPLGDFFGEVGGSAPHLSLPLGQRPDGTYYSFWYMPFAKGAHVSIKNESSAAVKMTWAVTHAPLDRPVSSLGYFHAKWHRDAFLPGRADRRPDWTLLTTQGRGRFVGTQLHVFQMRGPWWGEGDDKFFVDGEKFPSTFGTGSEDYFGYAWGSGRLFSEPFHGQALRDPGTKMTNASEYRYHISDSVPFQQSFEAAIEKYLPNDRTIYASVVYWYLSPTGVDPYGTVELKDRVDYWQNPPPNDDLLVEGVEMSWDWSAPNHPHAFAEIGSDGWADWAGKLPPGSSTKFTFTIQNAGKYQILLKLMKGLHDGIYQLALNDRKLGDPVDLYGATFPDGEPQDFGVVDLKAGTQTLGVTYVGKSSAIQSDWTDFQLKYLRLKPVP